MKRFLIQLYLAMKETKRNIFVAGDKQFSQSRVEANIIRNVHSIEKGLSIKNPRLGFGVAKIEKMCSLTEEYRKFETEDVTCLYFARDVLKAYLAYHKEKGFDGEALLFVQKEYEKLCENLEETDEIYGGVKTLCKDDLNFHTEDIETLFKTRCSVRDFTGEPVDEEVLKKAIALAQRTPSACNRQGVRVYSIDARQYIRDIGDSMEGIGGFAEEVDRFLIITGKRSAYGLGEKNQYIVSASMFAAYLTLTLHAYHIAACTVQRPLTQNEQWDVLKKKYAIPEDEQIIMLLAIGKMKEKTKVPVSKRFSVDKIYRKL